ncbi:MAG TPA: hypothetical protein VFJ02_13350 [Vicinamibacterales bacterium]|nr:hypothetical protein [Vicinamibacterales bacterium]
MFTATMVATVLVLLAVYYQAAGSLHGTMPAARAARRAARDKPPFDQDLTRDRRTVTHTPFRTGGRS